MGKFRDLPREIILDIITRLPTESALESKLVCKTWRDIVRDTDILLKNLDSADNGKLGFILKMEDKSEKLHYEFHYLEYDEEDSSRKIKKLIFNPQFVFYTILGSCNGLLCIDGLPNHYTVDESTTGSYVAYICNPITREVVGLPELDIYCKLVGVMVCGFGYVASTNDYKVVRMYSLRSDSKVAQIEVYTLGSGKGWRDAGKIHYYAGFSSIATRNAIFADGFLYWDLGYGRTEVFDLAAEKMVGYAQAYGGHLWYRALGGYLCGKQYSQDKKSTDVWLLKRKEDKSFDWCNEFSLIGSDPYNSPLARTSNGTVLGYSHEKLHLYDLESSSSKMLEDFGRSIEHVIPHVNTLVSIKAFGEENTKILEPYETVIQEAKGSNWQMKQP